MLGESSLEISEKKIFKIFQLLESSRKETPKILTSHTCPAFEVTNLYFLARWSNDGKGQSYLGSTPLLLFDQVPARIAGRMLLEKKTPIINHRACAIRLHYRYRLLARGRKAHLPCGKRDELRDARVLNTNYGTLHPGSPESRVTRRSTKKGSSFHVCHVMEATLRNICWPTQILQNTEERGLSLGNLVTNCLTTLSGANFRFLQIFVNMQASFALAWSVRDEMRWDEKERTAHQQRRPTLFDHVLYAVDTCACDLLNCILVLARFVFTDRFTRTQVRIFFKPVPCTRRGGLLTLDCRMRMPLLRTDGTISVCTMSRRTRLLPVSIRPSGPPLRCDQLQTSSTFLEQVLSTVTVVLPVTTSLLNAV